MRAGQDRAEVGVRRQHAVLGGSRGQHHLVISTMQTEVGGVYRLVTERTQSLGSRGERQISTRSFTPIGEGGDPARARPRLRSGVLR